MADPAPVILIGAARSGTKFLRDVLAAGRGKAAVPYDVNYVWRYGADHAADDLLDPATLTDRRKRFIRDHLRRLARARPGDQVFPDARYVHLIRDGRAVSESAMRQWQAPPDLAALARKLRQLPLRNAGYVAWFGWNFLSGLGRGRKGGKVWGPRFAGIGECAATGPLAQICARQWLECWQRASADLAALPAAEDRIFTVHYEDLTESEDTLRVLIDKLALPDPAASLAMYHQSLRREGGEKWQHLPEADRAAINGLLSPALRELGYAT